MAACAHDTRVPLPRNWPRRVRSAIIHAVSMAQTSLTLARGWAANSANARIRLKTENPQEISRNGVKEGIGCVAAPRHNVRSCQGLRGS